MHGPTKLITRIALFAALFYVLSWGTSFLPNVNLGFLVAFTAGLLWGAWPGILVGAVGMGVYTSFNPYGPASLPVAMAQVAGMALCGWLGYLFRPMVQPMLAGRVAALSWLWLSAAGVLTAVVFFLPVSVVDAAVYGPFWPRIVTGLPFTGIALGVNALVFPLLFGVTRLLYVRDRGMQ
jgi:uncharacterized membrane protein